MLEAVAQDDVADVVGLGFVYELGRMHPDDDELVGELGLETFQVRDDVDAIDAAVSPEVEQHHFAFEVGEGDRFGGIQPIEPGREFGRRVGAGEGSNRFGRIVGSD